MLSKKEFAKDYYERLYQEYDWMHKIFKRDPETQRELADACAQVGQWNKAIRCYLISHRLDPGNGNTLNNLALAYLEVQNYKKALFYIRKALKINPNNTIYLFNTGLIYSVMDDWSKAKLYFEQVRELDPNYGLVYHHLGVAYLSLGLLELATEILKKAKCYDQYAYTYSALGTVYVEQGLDQKAAREFRRACQLKPDHPWAYYEWAKACHRLGWYGKSIEPYKKALGIDPKNPEIYHNMGIAYEQLECFHLAMDCYHHALKLQLDLEILYRLGSVYAWLGYVQEALKVYQRLKAINSILAPKLLREIHEYTEDDD